MKHCAPNVVLGNRRVEEKTYALFAKHAHLAFQPHFIDVMNLFSFVDKTTLPNAQI